MKKKNMLLSLLLVVLGLAATGCVSHSAYVFARCDPRYSPGKADKISITIHDQPLAEEVGLDRALRAVLTQKGFHIVLYSEADYTMGYWVQDSWRKVPEMTTRLQQYQPRFVQNVSSSGRMTSVTTEWPPPPTEVDDGEKYFHSRGIELKLYPAAAARAGRFEIAWEGFVSAGTRVRPEQQETLLRLLLRYFGQNFNERIPLSTAVAQ